jgi:flagellar P-ring protein precursor FlgI
MATASVLTKNAASVLVVSADAAIRAGLRSALTAQRWEVHEADGGAAALLLMERTQPHATLLDGALPDLHLQDFAEEARSSHPAMDLIALDGTLAGLMGAVRSPRRGELLQVLRSVCDQASSVAAPATMPATTIDTNIATALVTAGIRPHSASASALRSSGNAPAVVDLGAAVRLPELIGESDRMLEVSRRIRLVAKRTTTVLIQGPTGTGKELVARAVHRLSPRADRPFIALNCAAIPEALLEAELFGHARGAFTGAVQRRTGRIEAAHGGTLFLDEIGEMPLALQSKLLRFLESGELQRVGENEPVRVDVRIVAATHQSLARRAQEGSFRADLYYRLAVFPVQTLISTLQRMGVNVPTTGSANTLRVQNMAAVFIAATLPPFAEPGTKLDVTVSSAGDAHSLNGGLLLMTALYGPDGRIYAQAQGPLVLGGYAATANGNAKIVNHPTTGRIPGGAMVERGVPLDLSRLPSLSILLNDADFRTAERMADAINVELKRPLAHAADSRRVDLHPQSGEDLPALLARVEAVEVETFPRAKVVVNERTGTVVIGGDVRLQPVSILHGGLVVNVVSDFAVSQPGPLNNRTTQTVQETRVDAQDKPVNQIVLKRGATVDDLVQELQGIGASARDVISILQAMKEAGALEAELEVL